MTRLPTISLEMSTASRDNERHGHEHQVIEGGMELRRGTRAVEKIIKINLMGQDQNQDEIELPDGQAVLPVIFYVQREDLTDCKSQLGVCYQLLREIGFRAREATKSVCAEESIPLPKLNPQESLTDP